MVVDKVMNENKTYAESVKNMQPSSNIQCSPTDYIDFRTIMKEAKNEELAEESDKKLRKRNIMLHGVKEADSTDIVDSNKSDEEYVKSFIGALEVTPTCKSVFRIGRPGLNKNRPIKLVMSCEEDKNKILSSLTK